MFLCNPAARSYCCWIRTATTELLGAPAARHRQLGCVRHLSVGQDAISEPHALLFTGTTWRHTEQGRFFKGSVQESRLTVKWSTDFRSNHTVVVWVFENGHRHHDGRWRWVKSAGGASLLQRGDGAAVLRRDVGVWTRTRRTHHPLQGLSYKEKHVTDER